MTARKRRAATASPISENLSLYKANGFTPQVGALLEISMHRMKGSGRRWQRARRMDSPSALLITATIKQDWYGT